MSRSPWYFDIRWNHVKSHKLGAKHNTCVIDFIDFVTHITCVISFVRSIHCNATQYQCVDRVRDTLHVWLTHCNCNTHCNTHCNATNYQCVDPVRDTQYMCDTHYMCQCNLLLSELIESATHIICVIDTLQHPATYTATHTATQHIISASIVLATHKVCVTHSTCVNTIWCSLRWSSSRHTIHLWLTHCNILQHTLQYILQRTLQHNPLSVRSSSSRYILLVCTLHAWQMSWHTLTCEIEFVTHITF